MMRPILKYVQNNNGIIRFDNSDIIFICSKIGLLKDKFL